MVAVVEAMIRRSPSGVEEWHVLVGTEPNRRRATPLGETSCCDVTLVPPLTPERKPRCITPCYVESLIVLHITRLRNVQQAQHMDVSIRHTGG